MTPAQSTLVAIEVSVKVKTNEFQVMVDKKRMRQNGGPGKIFVNSGACAYIEREAFGRAVMWWPCFHHILELVLGALIQKRWPTEGPRDGIYTRFKKDWPGILKKMDEIVSSAGEKVRI